MASTNESFVVRKRCTRCRRRKTLSSFYRHSRSADGHQSICIPCIRTYRQEWRDNNRDKLAAQYRRQKLKKYGITEQQYQDQLEVQNGGCAICGDNCITGRNLAVNHNHATNELRGLLCINCNIAIGNLRDSPELARKAADYLDG